MGLGHYILNTVLWEQLCEIDEKQYNMGPITNQVVGCCCLNLIK